MSEENVDNAEHFQPIDFSSFPLSIFLSFRIIRRHKKCCNEMGGEWWSLAAQRSETKSWRGKALSTQHDDYIFIFIQYSSMQNFI